MATKKFFVLAALCVLALLTAAPMALAQGPLPGEPPPTPAAPTESSGSALGAQAPLNPEGYSGPTTAEAKAALGLDVQRLRTEPAAFVWRSVPNVVNVTCPSGWICTFHLGTDEIKV